MNESQFADLPPDAVRPIPYDGPDVPNPVAISSCERVLAAVGCLQDAAAGSEIAPLVAELVDALADDLTVVELRQEVEFLRAELASASPRHRREARGY